jgi:hypothetical protein
MPLDKSNLKKYLSEKDILDDEKEMWFEVGFYIFQIGNSYSYRIRAHDESYCDISSAVGKAMRISIMGWWQTRKKELEAEKRLQAARPHPYDVLESRSG